MSQEITERLNDDLGLVSAETALDHIADDATVAVSGFGSVGYPKVVPGALAASERDFALTIFSGGSTGTEIDSDLFEAEVVARRYPYQARPESRVAVNDRTVAFADHHIARLGDDAILGQLASPDVAVIEAIAVGEGWLVPSTSLGHTRAFVEAADKLIVELNEAQPLELQAFHDVYRVAPPPRYEPIPLTRPEERIGGPKVTFDPEKLVAVVASDVRDTPYSFREPTDEDQRIAANLAEFLQAEAEHNQTMRETVHLQFGVGSLGNALMSAFGDVEFEGKDVVYFGEVIQDGLLDMLDAGNLRAATGTSLALSEAGQDRLFAESERYAEDIVLRPAELSNRAELIDRFGVVAVNAVLEVDIYGHANSTHVNGSYVLNGIGGSGDFARNAHLAVMALASTAKGGAISRIVPMVPHVDHTEHDFDVVVTEQGVADLRGLSPVERAHELIEHCAHPDYRDDLRAYIERAKAHGGHMPHDLETALSWHQRWRDA
jgi:succinyl-CoA:acetate CoA-transferase